MKSIDNEKPPSPKTHIHPLRMVNDSSSKRECNTGYLRSPFMAGKRVWSSLPLFYNSSSFNSNNSRCVDKMYERDC